VCVYVCVCDLVCVFAKRRNRHAAFACRTLFNYRILFTRGPVATQRQKHAPKQTQLECGVMNVRVLYHTCVYLDFHSASGTRMLALSLHS